MEIVVRSNQPSDLQSSIEQNHVAFAELGAGWDRKEQRE